MSCFGRWLRTCITNSGGNLQVSIVEQLVDWAHMERRLLSVSHDSRMDERPQPEQAAGNDNLIETI